MIYDSNCQPSLDNQEPLPNKKNSYPYVCQFSDMTHYINQSIPYHWHSALELDYVAEGQLLVHTSDSVLTLNKGDAVFINSGIIHCFQAKTDDTKIFAHIFDSSFLSGIPGSLIDQKFLIPVTGNTVLKTYKIHPDSYNKIKMLEKIIEIIELNKQEPSGYELKTRALLSLFWCMFLDEVSHLSIPAGTLKENIDMDRIKLMIRYIETHYMEKITLETIADAASISSRECTRCFQRTLGISPMKFLTEHRVNIAAQKLIRTNDSVLLIGEDCGFSSGSYFSKVFYEIMKYQCHLVRFTRAFSLLAKMLL